MRLTAEVVAVEGVLVFHYTDEAGYKAIISQVEWTFRASRPPGDHLFGAYFTTLPPGSPRLAARLGLPREKTTFVFCFRDIGDLQRVRGGRGEFILFSPSDYIVDESRKAFSGPSAGWKGLPQ